MKTDKLQDCVKTDKSLISPEGFSLTKHASIQIGAPLKFNSSTLKRNHFQEESSSSLPIMVFSGAMLNFVGQGAWPCRARKSMVPKKPFDGGKISFTTTGV